MTESQTEGHDSGLLQTSRSAPADGSFLIDFQRMGTFGETPRGGVDREAGTAADTEQRRWLQSLLETHGLRVEYDRIGNQYGLLELRPGAPYIIIGSHMDSQPTAGKFDGAYGVLAAAHAAFRLQRQWKRTEEIPKYNIAVVNWFNEEGSRFIPSMMGSAVYTGLMDAEDALATTDAGGTSVRAVLDDADFRSPWAGPEAAYAAEIHIEQGRLLEQRRSTIGLVTATWAASKYSVRLLGEQAHSGATIMEDRKDALYAAALLVVFTRELADRFPGQLHTSIGKLDVYPNSPVVVASEVNLLLDLRSSDEVVLAEANAELRSALSDIEKRTGVRLQSDLSHEWGVNPYQAAGVELSREVVTQLGYENSEILTVAGHDSVNLKGRVPTVMLFVPSVEGISHNELEYTRDADLLAGLDVLTHVVSKLARGALDCSGPSA